MKLQDTTQLVKIANERLAENNTVGAYPYLSQIAKALTEDVSSQVIAGCAAASLGKYSEARNWFERAKAIDPSNVEANHNLGLTHMREHDFERAAEDYGDVKIRLGTVGERAKSELYDIRHLSIGKVAPDIEGKDQDGKQFKLSDYRGKVVLLYFWSEF